MKINSEFVMREIAGECILVAVGSNEINFNGIITINDVGKFLWEQMQGEFTIDQLVDKLLEEYEVDRDTACKDVNDFVDKLKEHRIIT